MQLDVFRTDIEAKIARLTDNIQLDTGKIHELEIELAFMRSTLGKQQIALKQYTAVLDRIAEIEDIT